MCIIDGDIHDEANWTVYSYGTSPLPHDQLGRVAFDAEGNLWSSAISEGVAVVLTGTSAVAGDLDGDGDVDLADYAALFGCRSGPGGGPRTNAPSLISTTMVKWMWQIMPPCSRFLEQASSAQTADMSARAERQGRREK